MAVSRGKKNVRHLYRLEGEYVEVGKLFDIKGVNGTFQVVPGSSRENCNLCDLTALCERKTLPMMCSELMRMDRKSVHFERVM